MYGYAEQILEYLPSCLSCGKTAIGIGIYLTKIEQRWPTQEIRSIRGYSTMMSRSLYPDLEGEVKLFPACADCITRYEFRSYLVEPSAKEAEKIKVEVEKLFEGRKIKLPKERQNEEVV